jgi:hypothetical protein
MAIEQQQSALLRRRRHLLQFCCGLLRGFDRLLVDRDNDVALAQADIIGGATRVNLTDYDALNVPPNVVPVADASSSWLPLAEAICSVLGSSPNVVCSSTV